MPLLVSDTLESARRETNVTTPTKSTDYSEQARWQRVTRVVEPPVTLATIQTTIVWRPGLSGNGRGRQTQQSDSART